MSYLVLTAVIAAAVAFLGWLVIDRLWMHSAERETIRAAAAVYEADQQRSAEEAATMVNV